jgi:hypothetical protein
LSDPRRQLLLQIYAAVAVAEADPMASALASAREFKLATGHSRQPGLDTAERVAISLAHTLHIGGERLHVWTGQLKPRAEEAPAQRLALTAARLFAGHDDLLLLAAPVRGGPDARGGLIDGETCARIALAGLDFESELQQFNCDGVLKVAGDLVPALPSATNGSDVLYLALALKLSLAASARLLHSSALRPML